MNNLIHLDQSLFLTLNGLHTKWLDPIIYLLTQTWFWIPLYLLVFYFTIKKYKKKSIIPILLIFLGILISDQTCNLIKNSTERPRPSREVELIGNVHLFQKTDGNFYKGGKYGFPSAHAANSMVLAVFIIYFLSNKKKWILFSIITWSLLMGYTRIYLGVHYPLDVLSGYILGLIIAYPLFCFGRKWVLKIKE
jgi:undecaprenyl-diphosphatase